MWGDIMVITYHQYKMYKRNGALVTMANVFQSLIKYVTPANMHKPIVQKLQVITVTNDR